MDPIKINNVCFSLVDGTYSPEDQEIYRKQRGERGFDSTELWNLDCTILRFTLPRLKAFIEEEHDVGYPVILERDYPDCKDYNAFWWKDILPKMVKEIENCLDDNSENDGDLTLFFKYFKYLWT